MRANGAARPAHRQRKRTGLTSPPCANAAYRHRSRSARSPILHLPRLSLNSPLDRGVFVVSEPVVSNWVVGRRLTTPAQLDVDHTAGRRRRCHGARVTQIRGTAAPKRDCRALLSALVLLPRNPCGCREFIGDRRGRSWNLRPPRPSQRRVAAPARSDSSATAINGRSSGRPRLRLLNVGCRTSMQSRPHAVVDRPLS